MGMPAPGAQWFCTISATLCADAGGLFDSVAIAVHIAIVVPKASKIAILHISTSPSFYHPITDRLLTFRISLEPTQSLFFVLLLMSRADIL